MRRRNTRGTHAAAAARSSPNPYSRLQIHGAARLAPSAELMQALRAGGEDGAVEVRREHGPSATVTAHRHSDQSRFALSMPPRQLSRPPQRGPTLVRPAPLRPKEYHHVASSTRLGSS